MEVKKSYFRYDKKVVRNKIQTAINNIIEHDSHLLKVNANERSITHRLGMYLQEEFHDWDVDCEYNRNVNGNDSIPKRLINFRKKTITIDDDQGTTVFPDIIIHERDKENNFVVIEAKKNNNKKDHQEENCDCDKCKLQEYKSELHYDYAFFIVFPVGQTENDSIPINSIIHEAI